MYSICCVCYKRALTVVNFLYDFFLLGRANMLSFFAASQPFHQCNANSGLLLIYGFKPRCLLSSKAFLPSRYTAILFPWVLISYTLRLAFQWPMQDLYSRLPLWLLLRFAFFFARIPTIPPNGCKCQVGCSIRVVTALLAFLEG